MFNIIKSLGIFSNVRVKMLVVILILAGIVFSVRTNRNVDILVPVIDYVMQDSGWEEKSLAIFSQYIGSEFLKPLPVMNTNIPLQLPCQFTGVIKPYGWLWDNVDNRQYFHPGLLLEVNDDSPVLAIAGGHVVEIGEDEAGKSVKIQHNDNLFSYYRGLKEIYVDKGAAISLVKPIAKSKSSLYLELNNKEGPIDPQSVFQGK